MTTAIILSALSACTTEQGYNSAQGWQRNQCSRLLDRAELDRCMAQASVPYDTYKKDTESAAR
jgi:hypothetical protein